MRKLEMHFQQFWKFLEMHFRKLEMHFQNPWKSMEMHFKIRTWKCIFFFPGTQIQQQSVDTFSRHVPSFYTILCVEIYGKYKNSGPLFNKAMNLYRKILGDTQFVNEIKYLDLNSESLNSE